MRRRAIHIATGLFGFSLLIPVVLWAHAELTRSEPAATGRLEKAPTEIRLWFSETPEFRLTTVSLADSVGRAITLGALARGESKLSVAVPILGLVTAGRYVVHWSTAAADGHPSSGSYSFVVLSTAAPEIGPVKSLSRRGVPVAARVVDSTSVEMSAETLPYIATRALNFVALLALVGAVLFRWAVVARVRNPRLRADVAPGLASLAVISAAVLVISTGIRLLLQSEMMLRMSHTSVADLVTRTAWGQAWALQCVAGIVVLAGFAIPRPGNRIAWALAALMVPLLAVSPALGGHAASSPTWTAVAIGDDMLHVVAAAGWLGSLLCLATVAVPTVLRSTSPTRFDDVAELVNAFSPAALTFGGIVVATGVVSAKLRLGAWSALWTSDYGRVLIIKVAILSGALATGAYNWLRVRPSLGTAASTVTLRRSSTVELIIGLLVVAVTAVLVAVPTPFLR